MPLEGILETPWMMAVSTGNESLQKAMQDETVKWLKDGTIVELEKKYGIKPSAYSERMHKEYAGK